jgi:hypothetical protein
MVMSWVNDNAALFDLIFAFVVAISTVVYAYLTYKLVTETRAMRRVQTEPRLEIAIKPFEDSIHLLRLHVKNIGLGAARDVTFDIAPRKPDDDGAKALIADFSEAKFLTTGLSYLGPGSEWVSQHSHIVEKFKEKIASSFVVTARYKNVIGQRYEGHFEFDMSAFGGQEQLGKAHLYSMAVSLEKIAKDLSHLSTGFRRLKVETFDTEDRQQEEQRREEIWEKRRQDALQQQQLAQAAAAPTSDVTRSSPSTTAQ